MLDKETDLTCASEICCPDNLWLIACQSVKIDPHLKCDHMQST